jgi:hypothetical protein
MLEFFRLRKLNIVMMVQAGAWDTLDIQPKFDKFRPVYQESNVCERREQTPAYRLESHSLQFFKDNWAYHECNECDLGTSDFIGEEIVYYCVRVVWGMNYDGRILHL